MAKARRKTAGRRVGDGRANVRARLAPDWWLAGLAGLGVVLTAYLLFVHASGGDVVFCTAGSACDIVQESRWASLLGLPVALWGLSLYALTGWVACIGASASTRWQRLFTLVLIGLLISVYLTAVAWFALEAFCAWCLASLVLLAVMFVLLLVRRPAQTPARGWWRWMAMHAITLLPLLGLIAAAQAGWLSPPDDPRLSPLAQHLRESDVKFYGTFWCPECQKQKRRFGRAAEQLPYVECSPNGRNGPIAFECVQQGIEGFPTWIIRGERYRGVLEPEELARRTRFNKWNLQPAAPVGEEAP